MYLKGKKEWERERAKGKRSGNVDDWNGMKLGLKSVELSWEWEMKRIEKKVIVQRQKQRQKQCKWDDSNGASLIQPSNSLSLILSFKSNLIVQQCLVCVHFLEAYQFKPNEMNGNDESKMLHIIYHWWRYHCRHSILESPTDPIVQQFSTNILNCIAWTWELVRVHLLSSVRFRFSLVGSTKKYKTYWESPYSF